MIWHKQVIDFLKTSGIFQNVQLQGGKVRAIIDSMRFLDIHYDPLSGSYSYALIDLSLTGEGDKRLLGWDDFPHKGETALTQLSSFPHHYQERNSEGQWYFKSSSFNGNLEVEIPIVIEVIRKFLKISTSNRESL